MASKELIAHWIKAFEAAPSKALGVESPYSGWTGFRVFNSNASGQCPPTWEFDGQKWRYMGRRPIGLWNCLKDTLRELRNARDGA
jgi:hypothetical protein